MFKFVFTLIIIICSVSVISQETSDKLNVDSLQHVIEDKLISNPNSEYYLKALGDILVYKGLIKEAIPYYDRAILNYSDYEEALFARGIALYRIKNYDSAMIDINNCIKIDSMNSDYYYHKALIYHDLNKFNEALLNYDKSIFLNKYYINPYLAKGILFMESNNFDNAIDLFSMALIIEPNNINVLANRGYTYYKNSQFNLCISDFEKCILIDSTMIISYKWIGLAYHKLNNMNKSCEYLNKAISLNDNEVNELLINCK